VDLQAGYPYGDNLLILGTWRAADGTPAVEQFRISGLVGNDDIGFIEGISAVDVSALTDRSDDWVGVIDGGPGNDILRGTGARDRLDGGSGSDKVFGFGGDDMLWGDGGPGQGLPDDFDRIYAGQGNDDVIGGQGTNFLYAWSIDPTTGGADDGSVADLHFADGQSDTITDFTTGDPVVMLEGDADAPADGVLTRDAHFTLILADGVPVDVTVLANATNGEDGSPANGTIADLIDDINDALTAAGIRSQVEAGRNILPDLTLGNRITLSTTGSVFSLDAPIQIGGIDNQAITVLMFAAAGSSAGLPYISAIAAPTDFTLTEDAVFNLSAFLRVDPITGVPVSVAVSSITITADATTDNTTIDDLIADINDALARAFEAAGVPLQVTAGQDNGVLTLSSTKTSLTLLTSTESWAGPTTTGSTAAPAWISSTATAGRTHYTGLTAPPSIPWTAAWPGTPGNSTPRSPTRSGTSAAPTPTT